MKIQVKRYSSVVAVMAMLAGSIPASADWRVAHATPGNTGFARVDTATALSPHVNWAGSVGAGANPVVGPEGNVYIGTTDGNIKAYHADGSLFWTRKINPEHGGFYGSPAVGKDGSVFLVSNFSKAGQPNQAYLHKFNSGGGWLFYKPLPKASIYPFTDGGSTNAAPNIWEWNGREILMVPVKYKGLGREDVTLLAFDTFGGNLVARKQVSVELYEITSNGINWRSVFFTACLVTGGNALEVNCALLAYLTGDSLFSFKSPKASGLPPLPEAGVPMVGVAIVPNPQGGAPRIAMTDRKHDKVVYSFSDEAGFTELIRAAEPNLHFSTPPVVQPDGSTVTGTLEGILTKTGLNLLEQPKTTSFGMLTPAPTRHKDGQLLVVSRESLMTKFDGTFAVARVRPEGATIASAAASCTHVYMSTSKGFYSFDANTMVQLGTYPWDSGGGYSSPVIGQGGQVYAIVGSYLFTFPAPAPSNTPGATACDIFIP